MWARPSLSGSENSTRRSSRPGRSKAGSSVSGLEVQGAFQGQGPERIVSEEPTRHRRSSVRTRAREGRDAPVGCHEDLDVAPRIEAVELVDELEHRPLDLVVPSRAVVEARAADRVDLVEEDDAGLLAAGHLKELAHHARALADILLDELRADDADKGGVGPVGDGPGAERLARPRRAEQEDTLGRVDA